MNTDYRNFDVHGYSQPKAHQHGRAEHLRALRAMAALLGIATVLFFARSAQAAGTLTPTAGGQSPAEIVSHHAEVVINNGFAKTEVIQVFRLAADSGSEALYAFPAPKSASLSEMSITAGETVLQGEVLPRSQAQQVYREEVDAGNRAGLATKESYQRFEFRVAPLRPGEDVTVRFVYYQPIEIDTGVGRYIYPLEEGGTDEVAKSFWTQNDAVSSSLSIKATVKTVWPIIDVRVPGYEQAANITQTDEDTHVVEFNATGASLNRDFVLYYRLQDDLPGRVEVIAHRQDASRPGTFMMVVTPGADLQPLNSGADYVFVLDTSGSMSGKIAILTDGVMRTLGELRADDRFKVIGFSDDARDLTGGWQSATPENVSSVAQKIIGLAASGSTNLYEGIELAFRNLDDDRATSIVLVTDGVTNAGIVDPKAFKALVEKVDVRIFGFLLGNSANWPLMRLIAEQTGGFYAGISNADDILGQIMLAKSKVSHEALHDVDVSIKGIEASEMTVAPKKIYRGQQLVMFGRYRKGGTAKIRIEASLTGKDRVYETVAEFPAIAEDNPEIERLWAMDRIEQLELLGNTGQLPVDESQDAIRDLGVAYQLVTDETAMVVLSDEAFNRRGIERKNLTRTTREHAAQARRGLAPARKHRVDGNKPMFKFKAPRLGGGGGGALGGVQLLAIGLSTLVFGAWRRRRNHR